VEGEVQLSSDSRAGIRHPANTVPLHSVNYTVNCRWIHSRSAERALLRAVTAARSVPKAASPAVWPESDPNYCTLDGKDYSARAESLCFLLVFAPDYLNFEPKSSGSMASSCKCVSTSQRENLPLRSWRYYIGRLCRRRTRLVRFGVIASSRPMT
jgi:hypothetical protein